VCGADAEAPHTCNEFSAPPAASDWLARRLLSDANDEALGRLVALRRHGDVVMRRSWMSVTGTATSSILTLMTA
jgi:hypothetical protein